MQEKWIKWEPAKNLSRRYYVESVTERVEDKFRMVLSDADNKSKNILLSFPYGIDAHRYMEETAETVDRFRDMHKIDGNGDWTFFKIENSAYLKWLSEKSYGIADDRHLIHFCILGLNSVIDIVTNDEPTITFLE